MNAIVKLLLLTEFGISHSVSAIERRSVLIGMIGGLVPIEVLPSRAAANAASSSGLIDMRFHSIGEQYGWPASGFVDQGPNRMKFDYAYSQFRRDPEVVAGFGPILKQTRDRIEHRIAGLLSGRIPPLSPRFRFPDLSALTLASVRQPFEHQRLHGDIAALEIELAREYPQVELADVYLALNYILSPSRILEAVFNGGIATWAPNSPLSDDLLRNFLARMMDVSPGLSLRIAERYVAFLKTAPPRYLEQQVSEILDRAENRLAPDDLRSRVLRADADLRLLKPSRLRESCLAAVHAAGQRAFARRVTECAGQLAVVKSNSGDRT